MNSDSGSTLFASSSPNFSHFVKLCEEIRITKSKNMKVRLLSRYLSSLNDESLSIAVLFLSSRIFPLGSKFVINAGFGTIMQALSEISFLDKDQVPISSWKTRTILDQTEAGARYNRRRYCNR